MTSPSRMVLYGAQLACAVATVAIITATGASLNDFFESDWALPVLLIQVGFVAANETIMRLAADSANARRVLAAGRREDLEDSHDVVVEHLRHLELEKHKLTASDYTRERNHLLSVGAAALRELNEGAMSTETPSPAPAEGASVEDNLRALRDHDPDAFRAALASMGEARPVGGMAPEWRGAAWTMAVVIIVGVIYANVGDNAGQRRQGATMTGGTTVAESPMQPMAKPDFSAELAAAGDDLPALNALTEKALAGRDLKTALNANIQVLEHDPENLDGRVYRAVLTSFVQEPSRAIAQLDEITTAHPDHRQAWVYTGLLALQTGQKGKAVSALNKAIAIEDHPSLREALAQAMTMPEGGGAPAAPAAPAAAPTSLVTGTIQLANASATGQAVFVSLRDPAGGPPVAAKKLPPGPFPMSFELTSADRIMMGGNRPLPATFNLTVRLDSDGNAMSRPDTDPSAKLAGLAPGANALEITLE